MPTSTPSRCPACRYSLAGLDAATTCPECGGDIDRSSIYRPPAISRTKAIALILAPHIVAALVATGLAIGRALFPVQNPPEAVLGVVALGTLAYLIAAPLCAISGIYALLALPENARSRIMAAILGLIVGAAILAVVAIIAFVLAPALPD